MRREIISYLFADTLTGNTGDNILEGGAGADTLDGSAGNDTASYAGSSAGVQVDLNAGTAAGGDAAGDVLTSIENLIGSAFADTLTGDANVNSLNGGDGDDILAGLGDADTIDGGLGSDTSDYSASGAAVMVDLGLGTAAGGDAAGDMLTSIENLIGSC